MSVKLKNMFEISENMIEILKNMIEISENMIEILKNMIEILKNMIEILKNMIEIFENMIVFCFYMIEKLNMIVFWGCRKRGNRDGFEGVRKRKRDCKINFVTINSGI
jgi:hypothetical protein